jgi:hypothetical protein
VARFSSQKSTIFLTTITTHPTTISPSKNHVQHPTFPKPHQKTPVNRKTGSTGASDFFRETHRGIFTAGSSKPAHSTDKDSSPAEVVADNVAASAAAAAVAAHQLQADSIPPETPS